MPARRDHGPAPPAVDDRLVMPETRHEVIDGQVVYVSPADEAHGLRHSKICALLEAFVGPGWNVAADLLTRTSELGDMAPDASVYPADPDPVTGGRRLEELAFEVVSTERLGACGVKAARLAARGVRRVFAVDVNRERVLEWSVDVDEWQIVPGDAVIEDRTLVIGLPVQDLVGAAKADDAVARALLAKGNRVLTGALESRLATGRATGRAEAVIAVLRGRGLAVTAEQESRMLDTTDLALLDAWLARVATCASAEELLGT